MINTDRYSKLLQNVVEAKKERELLEQFAGNGGRFKLQFSCNEDQAIAEFLTELFRASNGFDVLISNAIRVTKSREARHAQTLLDEATGDAVAHSVQEAAQ